MKLTRLQTTCPCGKSISFPPCRAGRKYCSSQCYWSLGLDTRGHRNGKWVGDKIGKAGVHDWITTLKGKASEHECEMKDASCTRIHDWSNKTGQYRRVESDWWVLCRKHHRNYDYQMFGHMWKPNSGRFKKGQTPWNKKIN
jgi:hypothetical protein